jgi:hypothetical protein
MGQIKPCLPQVDPPKGNFGNEADGTLYQERLTIS